MAKRSRPPPFDIKTKTDEVPDRPTNRRNGSSSCSIDSTTIPFHRKICSLNFNGLLFLFNLSSSSKEMCEGRLASVALTASVSMSLCVCDNDKLMKFLIGSRFCGFNTFNVLDRNCFKLKFIYGTPQHIPSKHWCLSAKQKKRTNAVCLWFLSGASRVLRSKSFKINSLQRVIRKLPELFWIDVHHIQAMTSTGWQMR